MLVFCTGGRGVCIRTATARPKKLSPVGNGGEKVEFFVGCHEHVLGLGLEVVLLRARTTRHDGGRTAQWRGHVHGGEGAWQGRAGEDHAKLVQEIAKHFHARKNGVLQRGRAALLHEAAHS